MFFLFLLPSILAQTCRVLVLSGGGSHGAYEAGVFSGLVYNLPMEEVEYDVVTGISIGSINAVGISQFPVGQEQEAARYMTFVWRTLNSYKSVQRRWPGGILAGFFFHSGLVDTTPERETLNSVVKGPMQRKVMAGSTNANTGEYATFNETLGREGMINATLCSSSIPVAFPLTNFNGTYYMDGFVKYHMDVTSGVKRCLEETVQRNITVDMVSCSDNFLQVEDTEYTTIEVMKRAQYIHDNNNLVRHLELAMEAFPDVNYRYYIRPSEKLPGELGLDFSDPSLEKSIKIGYNDAKNAVQNGQVVDEVLREMKEKQIVWFP
jgi:predicted acylesterase/phospholipase RssA